MSLCELICYGHGSGNALRSVKWSNPCALQNMNQRSLSLWSRKWWGNRSSATTWASLIWSCYRPLNLSSIRLSLFNSREASPAMQPCWPTYVCPGPSPIIGHSTKRKMVAAGLERGGNTALSCSPKKTSIWIVSRWPEFFFFLSQWLAIQGLSLFYPGFWPRLSLKVSIF